MAFIKPLTFLVGLWFISTPVQAQPLEQWLITAPLSAGIDYFKAQSGPQAQFEQGLLLTLKSVETFLQGLERHGLMDSLRRPWQETQYQPITYGKIMGLIRQLRDDLVTASAVLEQGGTGTWKVLLHPARIVLDINGDHQRSPEESNAQLLRWWNPAVSAADAQKFAVNCDAADSLWLAGYTRLLSAALDLFLAYDWEPLYQHYGDYVFPQRADAKEKSQHAPQRLKVVDAKRGEQARQSMLKVIALSRQTWIAIQAETDDDLEWLVGPKQHSVLGMAITPKQITDWHLFLDDWEAALQGEKFPAHPPLNLKALLQNLPELNDDIDQTIKHFMVKEPRPEQLIASDRPFFEYLSGNNLMYALWIN